MTGVSTVDKTKSRKKPDKTSVSWRLPTPLVEGLGRKSTKMGLSKPDLVTMVLYNYLEGEGEV